MHRAAENRSAWCGARGDSAVVLSAQFASASQFGWRRHDIRCEQSRRTPDPVSDRRWRGISFGRLERWYPHRRQSGRRDGFPGSHAFSFVKSVIPFRSHSFGRSGFVLAWRKCMGRFAGTASPVVLPVALMSPRLVATADSERLSPAVGATKYRGSESAVHVRCQPHLPGSYLREVGTILPTCVG